MNRRLFTVFIIVLIIVGCVRLDERNRENLLNLKDGMTKQQVLQIMGKPYKTESYRIENGMLEFWMYYTDPPARIPYYRPKLNDSNFTPLAFENGILTGWGRNFYDHAMKVKVHIGTD
jgi:hypothetical protein